MIETKFHFNSSNTMTVRLVIAVIIWMLTSATVVAKHNSEHPLSDDDWKEVMERISLLDDSALMPSLLPIIMSNSDALQLTDEQIEMFRNWRKTKYVNMVNIMDKIIYMKVEFGIETLSSSVQDQHLIELQNKIHRLQKKLLIIRLSCRKMIMETFTDEQWENFDFIVTDNPKLSSLFSQSHSITGNHKH